MRTQARKDFDATELIITAGVQALLHGETSRATELLICQVILEVSAHGGQALGTMMKESLQ